MDIANDIKSLQIDPAWGFLGQNLRREGKSKEEIEAIQTRFSEHFLDETRPIDDWMRSIYQKTFLPAKEQKELIRRIYLYIKRKVEKLFLEYWASKAVYDQEKVMMALEKKIGQQMSNLILLGQSSLFGGISYNIFKSQGRIVFDPFSELVWTNYKEGKLVYFGLLARMLEWRDFLYLMPSDENPINDVKRSVQIINRLADLQVKEALHAKAQIYERNSIGKGRDSVKLTFTVAQRLTVLEELAQFNGLPYEETIAKIMYCGNIDGDKIRLSPAERGKYFQELVANETEFNFYITTYYEEDGGSGFRAGLGLTKCLAILEERAKRGDETAYKILIEVYIGNELGLCNKRSLNMKPEARWKKLQELKPINAPLWTTRMAWIYYRGYLSPEKWLIPLSRLECYQWLIKNIEYLAPDVLGKLINGGCHHFTEEDQPENLHSKEGRVKFYYDLALANQTLRTVGKEVSELLFPDDGSNAVNLPSEKRFTMVEKLAFAGYGRAQWTYQKVIGKNPDKYLSNPEQHWNVGKIALLTRNKNAANCLIGYLKPSKEKEVILKQLVCYQQVLYEIDMLSK